MFALFSNQVAHAGIFAPRFSCVFNHLTILDSKLSFCSCSIQPLMHIASCHTSGVGPCRPCDV